jgi:acyl-coenzyme A thioesterase 13
MVSAGENPGSGDPTAPPAGFEPVAHVTPVTELIGPIYSRNSAAGYELCLLAQPKHSNLRGNVHGGILATLADIALGYALTFSSGTTTPVVTASLTLDYAGSASIGDWMMTRTDIQRRGTRLAFANCFISVGERRIVRASGVFVAMNAPTPR